MSVNLRRILVPVDFSETSDKAFDYALSFARVFNAGVLTLHVLDDPILYAPTTDPSFRAPFERAMEGKLERLVGSRGVEGVHVDTAIAAGTPFYEIIQRAKADDIDLIVIGTHGTGPIKHMLMGSVAEKVVRKAPCPVLAVRPDQHQFVSP